LSDFGLPIFFISALIPPIPTLYFLYDVKSIKNAEKYRSSSLFFSLLKF